MSVKFNNSNESVDISKFTPMSEEQMAITKGGTDYPDWFNDLLEQVEDLLELLGFPTVDGSTVETDFWDDHGETMEELGIDPLEQ